MARSSSHGQGPHRRRLPERDGAHRPERRAPELLAGLFSTLGAKPDEADQYADRIVAWRTPASVTQDVAAYRGGRAGLRSARRLVRPCRRDLAGGGAAAGAGRAGAALSTVFSGRADVLAREADPIVLAALPGAGPERQAETPDPRRIARRRTPGRFARNHDGGGDAMRVTVRIDFDNGGGACRRGGDPAARLR